MVLGWCLYKQQAELLKLEHDQILNWLQGPRMVRDVFRLAKENAPAIIFIDEVDAIATARFDAQTGADRYCTTQFCLSWIFCPRSSIVEEGRSWRFAEFRWRRKQRCPMSCHEVLLGVRLLCSCCSCKAICEQCLWMCPGRCNAFSWSCSTRWTASTRMST